jgi:hypothetical protein
VYSFIGSGDSKFKDLAGDTTIFMTFIKVLNLLFQKYEN